MLQIWNKLKLFMVVALMGSFVMLNSAWAEDPIVKKHNADPKQWEVFEKLFDKEYVFLLDERKALAKLIKKELCNS